MLSTDDILKRLAGGDFQALARAITMVENDLAQSRELLKRITPTATAQLIGITGPPGAGKSTLTNQLISYYTAQGLRVGVIAVDPTSPFNFGSLLGDRLRMSEHFTSDKVFIRSLATRGSLGGLSSRTIEITDVMRAAGFDKIIIETVGVGQSEVEVAGLADTCVLVLVPESGDDIQTIKSGIMEVADIFVVNKSDRDGADQLANTISKMVVEQHPQEWQRPVLKVVASQGSGIAELASSIGAHADAHISNKKKNFLLAEKAYHLIKDRRMGDVDRKKIVEDITAAGEGFNVYQYIEKYT